MFSIQNETSGKFSMLNHKILLKKTFRFNTIRIYIWGKDFNRCLSHYHCEVFPQSLTSRVLKDQEPAQHPCFGSLASPSGCIGCCIVPAAFCPQLLSHTGRKGHLEGTKEVDWGPLTSPCRVRNKMVKAPYTLGPFFIHPFNFSHSLSCTSVCRIRPWKRDSYSFLQS